MTGVLMKRGNLDVQMKAEIRSDVSASQGTPRWPANQQMLGDRQGQTRPHCAKKELTADNLTLDFQPPEL